MSTAPQPGEMPTQYDPKQFEDATYERWEKSGVFHSEPKAGRKPYTIMIPPPNVTGVLHIGHALNNSLQDLLVRFRRMQGRETLWLPGTDHAGIATQNVVEKQIAKNENKSRYEIGREELIKRIWDFTNQSGDTILKQLRKLGASCDWQRKRFTLDEGLNSAVREAFVKLFKDGLLYRGKYLVNWCPRCRTTLSDDEVEHEEVNGRLYELHYPFADSASRTQNSALPYLTVATTRPETMLGDTAVAVHPDDERYKHLIGQKVKLPLTGREIPIIGDAALDREFGTGCLKVTPAHDPVDYQIGLRHKLQILNILTEDGRLNEECPPEFRGMDRYKARKAVMEALKALGLTGEIKDHKQQVGHCYRCHTMIEPFLTSQWFVNMKPLSKLAVAATASGRVKFHPERWTKVYLNWFEDVRDWPISRQIWWGHQVPAWYCLEDNAGTIEKIEAGPDEPFEIVENGKRYRYLIGEHAKPIVASEDPSKLPQYQGKTLVRDPDVLDTWFSSALWPFSTLGWPEKTKELEYYYPTDTLVTSRGIIYFWVARMVMMGEHLLGKEPYRDVVIHGTVLDGDGAVMSKSKGNGIDPLDIIQRYGADAMRFTIFDMATEGQDIKFPVQIVCPHCDEMQELPRKRTEPVMKCAKCKQDFQQPVPNEPTLAEPKMGALDSKRFEKGRNFTNKVWNAARFVLTSIDADTAKRLEDHAAIEAGLRDEDRWILSRLTGTINQVTIALDNFDFSRATNKLYTFFWDEFCAWTIELSKSRLQPGSSDKTAATAVLVHVLDRSLRLLHPFCPFISEVLWAELARKAPTPTSRNLGYPPTDDVGKERPFVGEMLAGSCWPDPTFGLLNTDLEDEFLSVLEAVRAVRNIRQKNGIQPKEALSVFIKTTDDAAAKRLLAQKHILVQMANVKQIEIGLNVQKPKPAGTEVFAGAELYVALAGLIDPAKERERLAKEIERTQHAVNQGKKKLGDDKFVKNAPPDKVDAEKARLAEYRAKVASLQAALKDLD
ncbi:MAG: valine--tRNA ligase [Planctomycetes bacterium]|nr:valine--tRNA ligase [Planctomycetota bacterium]